MRTWAVVGANYGDEGKGLFVDALCRQLLHPLVIRHNSSAQAGHTVTTSDGRRHVFHHWGSGSLMGASTFLGKQFVVHPLLALPEFQALKALGANTTITIDPRARVATPFDVMLNQAAELRRGELRHGSCGVGFGEAIERSGYSEWSIRAADLDSGAALEAKLRQIREEYLPQRLAELGLEPHDLPAAYSQEGLIERFVEQCAQLKSIAQLATAADLPAQDWIFEGAQGLALDEEIGCFPHVTRARTGLPDIVEICEEAEREHLEVLYASRCYLTRHGAGPLPDEQPCPPWLVDQTNLPHPFQGALRYAPLDPTLLRGRILSDVRRVQPTPVQIQYHLAVSCLDQPGSMVQIKEAEIPAPEAARYVGQAVAACETIESWGPTSSTIRGKGLRQ